MGGGIAVRPPLVACLKRASTVDVLRGLVSLFVVRAALGDFSRRRCRLVGRERTASRHMSVSPPLNDCRIGFPCGDTVGASFFNSD